MQPIPPALQTIFEDHLRNKAIPDPLLWSYSGARGSDQAKFLKFKCICSKNSCFWPQAAVFTDKIGVIRNVKLSQFIDSIGSHDFPANRLDTEL